MEWPVLLAVTSLPPGIRMNAENLILAGVWQGPVKPPMKLVLGPVIEKKSAAAFSWRHFSVTNWSQSSLCQVADGRI